MGCSSRSSPALRARRLARADALEISDSLATLPSLQREDSALRVRASNDPAARRQFKWAFEDLTATGLHTLRRRTEVADVEIIEPKWSRHRLRLGEYAADRLSCGRERLIHAHRSNIRVRFSPAKDLAVEGKRLFRVGGEQLVPADAARCAGIGGLFLAGLHPL